MEKELIFDKKQHTIYFATEKSEYNRAVCFQVTGKDPEDIKSYPEYLELAIETALGNTKHIKSKLEEAEKEISVIREKQILTLEQCEQLANSNANLADKLAERESTISALKTAIETYRNGVLETEEELSKTLQKAKESEKQLENLKTNEFKLQPNQHVVEINPFKLQYLQQIAQNSDVKNLYAELNRKGKYDGCIDRLDNESEIQRIFDLSVNAVICQDRRIFETTSLNKYPHVSIIPKTVFEKAFLAFKNNG